MRVIAATDGSDEAVGALDWLVYFPFPERSTIELLSVVGYPELGEGIRQALRTHTAATTLDRARRRLSPRWISVTARVLDGDPREAIVAAAMRQTADLIVLGARGLGAINPALIGRVSIAVERHAPCPVLVCKGD